MKRNQQLWIGLLAVGLLSSLSATAQPNPVTNRLTLSARFGLNISGKFSGTSPIAVPPASRTTPNSDAYNYDDGYVLPDVSGSVDGYTWYWGYDDSGSQVDSGANTILLSRSTGTASLRSPDLDDDPSLGAELTYVHELGTAGDVRYGFEAALNFLNLSLGGGGSYGLTSTRTTDAYPYFPGTTPPGATPGSPYQGSFDGPGFIIGTTPVSSTTSAGGPVGTVTGSRQFDGTLWGGRLGPYAELYLDDDVSVSLSGGLALGWLHGSVDWNETLAFTGGGSSVDVGSGSDNALLWGGYVAGNLYWRLSEKWTAAGSVQFQSLGNYDEAFGTRRVELDLSKSFFFTIGLSYNF